MTLDGVRDQFFVAHRACERFSKALGAIAQKLQDSKADDPWLTEVRVCCVASTPVLLCSSAAVSFASKSTTEALHVLPPAAH